MEFDQRVSLVSGSSSGLGKAAAISLAQGGANVVLNGRSDKRLDRAVNEVDAVGSGTVMGVAGDLTDPDDIERLVETTVDEFGRLDHLVSSAGGPPEGKLWDIDDAEMQDGFDLLVLRFIRLARAAGEPLAEDGGGTIVNISSIGAKESLVSQGFGDTLHMAPVGIAKILARQLGPEVRVNTILPGLMETPRMREHIEAAVERGDYDSYEAGLDSFASGASLDRVGEPSEIGDAVAYLSSDRSSFITGVALPVDGGITQSIV